MYVPPPRSVSCWRTAAFAAASTALGVNSFATTPPLATSVRVGVGRTTAEAGITASSTAADPVVRRRRRERRDGIEGDVAEGAAFESVAAADHSAGTNRESRG